MDTKVVVCLANEALADFLVRKREEWFVKQYSDNLDFVFIGAHRKVCESAVPLPSLGAVSKVKGIGPWPLKLLKEFYKEDKMEVDDKDKEQPGVSLPIWFKIRVSAEMLVLQHILQFFSEKYQEAGDVIITAPTGWLTESTGSKIVRTKKLNGV